MASQREHYLCSQPALRSILKKILIGPEILGSRPALFPQTTLACEIRDAFPLVRVGYLPKAVYRPA